MGSKKGKQMSTGLTPMMNRSRIGDQTSPGESDKENIDPNLRRSARKVASSAKRSLFDQQETARETRSKSRSRASASPQKNSPRKRAASARGDRQREQETSPSKKSTDRPRRDAKAKANVQIANYHDAATPPQPTTHRARKVVLQFDNVDIMRSPPAARSAAKPGVSRNFSSRAGWMRGATPDEDSDDEEEKSPITVPTPRAERRVTRAASVGRGTGGTGGGRQEEQSPSKQLEALSSLVLHTPAKRGGGGGGQREKSPARTIATRTTPARTNTVSRNEELSLMTRQLRDRTPTRTSQEARVLREKTPTRAAAVQQQSTTSSRPTRQTPARGGTTATAKELSYTPKEKLDLKLTLAKVADGNWRKRSMDTPKTVGRQTRVARIARKDRDASYEPTATGDVNVEESDESEDEEETSSEENEEEEEEEVQHMKRKRQRGGRGKGGRGATATPSAARSSSRARGAATAPTPARSKFRLQLEEEDEDEDEPMDVSEAPSSLAAALDRLAVYRCPRGTLLCREAECAQIKEFIRAAIAPTGISQACYISGVPGTGKTASVMAMVKELRAAKGCRPFVFLRVNAMYYSDPKQVFSELLYEYERRTRGEENVRRLSGAAARKRLNALFECVDSQRPPVLLLVDELDQLSTKKQELIYDVFNWSAVEAARVSIISIANTLDLPERMLNQRICSRLGMNRIVFQPYTHSEIERIVLAQLGGTSDRHEDAIIDPQVVEIAARKVAAISGDLRKATDILRAAIEAAMRKGEKRLTFEQVKEAIRAASETLLVLAVRSLSRHQEIVFDAAVDIVRTRDVSDFSMADLVEKYESMSMMVHDETPMNYHGVTGVLFQLASLGLVRFSNPSERALFRRRLRLLPAVHDAASALKIVAQRRTQVTVA